MPILAATVISRASLENIFDRTASWRPLRCMMFLNCEWPAMASLSSSRGFRNGGLIDKSAQKVQTTGAPARSRKRDCPPTIAGDRRPRAIVASARQPDRETAMLRLSAAVLCLALVLAGRSPRRPRKSRRRRDAWRSPKRCRRSPMPISRRRRSASAGPGLRRRRRDDHLCRPFDLHHRDAGRRADRHRLFSGVYGANPLPRVVTMNKAHRTHYSDFPDPGIEYVLRGWNPDGGPARHALVVDDVYIRNVPTDIRNWRRARRRRQFDLHLRGGRPLHRPSRPSASPAGRCALRRDRPARHRHGADRRRHDAVARRA